MSFAQIAAALSHEFARIDIYAHDDLVAFTRNVFLHHDRIGAEGHRCAGENPNRFARRKTKLPIHPSRLLRDHAQSGARSAVACDHRVTVHRRVVKIRQRQSREVILRRETIERLQDRQPRNNRGSRINSEPPRGQRPQVFKNLRPRFFFAYHYQILRGPADLSHNSE